MSEPTENTPAPHWLQRTELLVGDANLEKLASECADYRTGGVAIRN